MKSQLESAKILYVITQGFWGGAQHYVFDLATNLPPNYQVTVAIGEPDGAQELQQALKKTDFPGSIIQLSCLVRAIRPFQDLRAIFELRRLYKKGQFTAVHLNSSKAGIIGSLATIGLKQKPKIIYTVHGWVFLEPLAYPVRSAYRFLEKYTAHLKNHIIVLSAKEKRIAHNLKIPEQKLSIIHPGITMPNFYSASEAKKHLKSLTKISAPKYWIGTIANLYLTKGLDLLIKAAVAIIQEKPGAHFFIIGTGAEKTTLEQLIAKNNLQKNIHLTGAIPNAASLLKAFDLFVLPSRKEGRPYTVSEAMAAGIPIVATAVGGVSELVGDYSPATLCLPNNVPALTDAILANLNNPSSNKKSAAVQTVADMVLETTSLY